MAQEELNAPNARMGVVVCNAPLDANLDEVRDKAKRLAGYVEVL